MPIFFPLYSLPVVYGVKKDYIEDLSGRGAEIYGGRWNNKGQPVIYTASNISLAVLEVFVHIPCPFLPKNMYIAEIYIPDDTSFMNVEEQQLPLGWNRIPPNENAVNWGSKWLESKSTLTLSVPSVIVKYENNILINPRHEQINKVILKEIKPFEFDGRMFKK